AGNASGCGSAAATLAWMTIGDAGALSSAKASSAKLGAITAMTSASRCGLRVLPRLPLHNSVFMAILGHQSNTWLLVRNPPKVGLPAPWRRAASFFRDL